MSSKLFNIEHCAILVKSWLIRYLSIKFSSPAAGFTYSTTKHMQQSSLNCKGFWIHSFQKNHACGRSWRYGSLYLEEIPPLPKKLATPLFCHMNKILKTFGNVFWGRVSAQKKSHSGKVYDFMEVYLPLNR